MGNHKEEGVTAGWGTVLCLVLLIINIRNCMTLSSSCCACLSSSTPLLASISLASLYALSCCTENFLLGRLKWSPSLLGGVKTGSWVLVGWLVGSYVVSIPYYMVCTFVRRVHTIAGTYVVHIPVLVHTSSLERTLNPANRRGRQGVRFIASYTRPPPGRYAGWCTVPFMVGFYSCHRR